MAKPERRAQAGQGPRGLHEFEVGGFGDPSVPAMGRRPAPPRDLIGLRGLYDYGPEHVFEHIYLSSERYAWQSIVGPLQGQADLDLATTHKSDDYQYTFAFREFGLPVATVCFHNWDQKRSTGKFFAMEADGPISNTPTGVFIHKLSMAFYPPNRQPV